MHMVMNGMRQSIENEVAGSYGLPETGPKYRDENTERRVTRTGLEFKNEKYGADRGRVIEEVRELENLAKENGINIFFEKSGNHVETKTSSDESEGCLYFHENSSWVTSGTVRKVHKYHFYSITGYQSLYLLENIERLNDVSRIEKAIGDRKAEAAFCVLDELLEKYGPKPELEKTAQKLLGKAHYEFYKGQKERAMEAGKQLSIVRLFGLTDGKIYTRLGELAGEELEKKKNGIEKSFSLIRPYKMGRAFKYYRETLDRIETLKAQFIKA